MRKLIINKGERFGNLEILSEEEKEGNMRVFNVKCIKCGNIKITRLNSLIHSKTGCICTHKIYKKRMKLVTEKWSILNKRYLCILNRCNNKKNIEYKNYGGRGIIVEWCSFQEFYNDMSETFVKGLTIDRINNNGNYSKNNCRWVTNTENQNNKRNNIIIEGGITLAQLLRNNNILIKNKYSCALRYHRLGLTVSEILRKLL